MFSESLIEMELILGNFFRIVFKILKEEEVIIKS